MTGSSRGGPCGRLTLFQIFFPKAMHPILKPGLKKASSFKDMPCAFQLLAFILPHPPRGYSCLPPVCVCDERRTPDWAVPLPPHPLPTPHLFVCLDGQQGREVVGGFHYPALCTMKGKRTKRQPGWITRYASSPVPPTPNITSHPSILCRTAFIQN